MRCLIERRKQIFRGAAILAACLALVLIAKGRVRQGAREPQETSLRDEIPMVSLRDEFKAKIEDLQTAGLWKPNRSLKPCRNTRGSDACYDTACHQRPSEGLEERLQNVRRSAVTVDTAVRNDIMKILNVQPSGKRVLIITGASSDHFLESQGLIQSLHQNVFPELNNYTFVYYDLGLKAKQIQQLKKHCQCEVRRFPVEKMPPMHQKLRCYTWKAFIIEANIRLADILIWADASVRFHKSTIGPLLKEANAKGIMMEAGLYPFSVSDHVQKIMFDYFAEQTCYFAQVGEMQATFLVFKNERFIREAILKPWLACALDSRCMCPSDPEKLLMCNINVRKYNKCHRFDQAALNIILAKLFWGYEQSFTPSRKYIDVNRDGKVHYFDHL
ncbi:uncharacterized protein LOC124282256 [Haliotis rubra]|uniref:uncharacterized protein LOC124282256 n=1 Tax=Haliotis rubra TaxID=36100 RepID=UPI001EE61491|nr:uncharacterized protein LOC124282256 [Haliotis rubra]